MKKHILDLQVSANERLNEQYFLLKLTSDQPLPAMLPAQFAQVRVDGSPQTFLRRPISIHFVDFAANELWLLVQKVGAGTRKLSELKTGDTLNLMLPLGNSFTLPADKNAALLLVGGGVGVAPLLFFGKFLRDGGFANVNFLLGARSAKDLLQLAEFRKYGTVYTTTEDGSQGEKGFVTQHSVLAQHFDFIYACGPTPMMRAVGQYAIEKDIPCEVSLENTMACGVGACLCCVTETTEGNKCVCTEGAVFDVKKLKEMMK
jgi:dihydroorotate dehydrogenase electron transfer subunit